MILKILFITMLIAILVSSILLGVNRFSKLPYFGFYESVIIALTLMSMGIAIIGVCFALKL